MAKSDVKIAINTNVWDEFVKGKTKDLNPKQKTRAGILAIAEESAKKMREYAQANRPWADRTGYAKLLLQGVVGQIGKSSIESVVAHGVDYGVYLEYAFQRKYAILEKARDAIYPEAEKAVGEMLGTTKYIGKS